jgi:hypothetical protein
MVTGVLSIYDVLEVFIYLWYIQRDDRNFWEIGPRTHLELRSLIEQVLTSEENGGDENNQFVHRLPQVLFY